MCGCHLITGCHIFRPKSQSTLMAGMSKKSGLKLEPPSPARKRAQQKRLRNRKTVLELVEDAKKYNASDIPVQYISVLEALEMVLDRAVGLYQLAQKKVDALTEDQFWVPIIDAQGNHRVEPNKWVQYEDAMRTEVFDCAARMQSLKIDERRIKIAESQQEMLSKALIAAAIAAGLNEAQQKTLGAELRMQLQELQAQSSAPSERLQAALAATNDERSIPPPPYIEGRAVGDESNNKQKNSESEAAA